MTFGFMSPSFIFKLREEFKSCHQQVAVMNCSNLKWVVCHYFSSGLHHG